MQTQTKKEQEFCKKLVFGQKESPTILYGLIVSEDEHYLLFRTAKRKYRISQSLILSIEDTTMEFREVGDYSD